MAYFCPIQEIVPNYMGEEIIEITNRDDSVMKLMMCSERS